MEQPKPVLVAIGGVAGATVRWAALHVTDGAAWALTGVNALGGLLLGMVLHGLFDGSESRRLLLGVGFCGALTTFSTFAVDIAEDLDRGALGDAIGTVLAGFAIGLVAAVSGASTRRAT